MAGFWDLPKELREKIYRMHLVQQNRVTYKRFKTLSGCTEMDSFGDATKLERIMPNIFQVSRKLEQEVSPIFFGENTFTIAGQVQLAKWVMRLWPRHARQIRSVYLTEWAPQSMDLNKKYHSDGFRKLASMFRIKNLAIVVDESRILISLLREFNSSFVWHLNLRVGPQMYLHMARAAGMAGLRSLRDVESVEFIHPKSDQKQALVAGGFLETVVKREIMQSSDVQALDEGHFRFMDLPPELRNNVYAMLMVQEGSMFVRTGEPTSIKAVHTSRRASFPFPHSALSILLVNRLINREAYSLFYQHNDFAFADPMRLQHFVISLGHERLDCIRSMTFFYKKGPLAAGGLTTMDGTLSTLRLLKNLRKLHILIPIPAEIDHPKVQLPFSKILRQPEANPATLPGAKILFSFRNLTNIKVFPPLTAKSCRDLSARNAYSVSLMEHAFDHFNHGLLLAQKGHVCHELYESKDWMHSTHWPRLSTQKWVCGSDQGCICRQNNGDGDSGDDANSA